MVCCVDVSELAGPQQDLPGAGRGRGGDAAAQEKVLLLRPERGLQRPGPAQPALRAGLRSASPIFIIIIISLSLFNQVSHVEIKISFTRETWPRWTAVHSSNTKQMTNTNSIISAILKIH